MNNLNLTVVMAVTNEENLEESVSSYLACKKVFGNVKLLIADLIRDEKSESCLKKVANTFSDSVTLLEGNEFNTRAEIYSKGLSLLSEGYVCFTESAVTLTDEAVDFVGKAISEHPDCPVEISVKTRNKNEKFIGYSKLDGLSEFCDLNEAPYNAALAIFGYFFRTEDIKDISFDLSVKEEALKKFILEALLKKPFISYSNKVWCKSTRALENDSVLFDGQYDKAYYTESIRKFMIPFMEKLLSESRVIPSYVQ